VLTFSADSLYIAGRVKRNVDPLTGSRSVEDPLRITKAYAALAFSGSAGCRGKSVPIGPLCGRPLIRTVASLASPMVPSDPKPVAVVGPGCRAGDALI